MYNGFNWIYFASSSTNFFQFILINIPVYTNKKKNYVFKLKQ